jgi:hypothetical protein
MIKWILLVFLNMVFELYINYLGFKWFFNKYEFFIYIYVYITFFGFQIYFFFFKSFFFFFKLFFFLKNDWVFLSYNCNHSVLIYNFLYLFLSFLFKDNFYCSVLYVLLYFFLGFVLGGQWAFFAHRWGFFWSQDFIELLELIVGLFYIYYFHVKSLNCLEINFVYCFFYFLIIILLIRCGFFISNHSFFNLLLFNNFYLFSLTYMISSLWSIFDKLVVKFLLIFPLKLIKIFWFSSHSVFFWVYFAFYKFFSMNYNIHCFFWDKYAVVSYFYKLRFIAFDYIYFCKFFISNFCFSLVRFYFFLEKLLVRVVSLYNYFFLIILYLVVLFVSW